MNVFVVSLFGCLLVGAMGAQATLAHGQGGPSWIPGVGVASGIAVYLACLGAGHLLLRLTRWNRDVVRDGKKSTGLQWATEMISVFLVILAPFITWWVAKGLTAVIRR